MSAVCIKIGLLCFYLFYCQHLFADSAPVQLAKIYSSEVHVSNYWVSEKLDGIRAYWDGTQLLTRQGNEIKAPDWFVKSFPATAMDGELWIGRNQFQKVMSFVSKHQPVDIEWQQVKYMLFDLPTHMGPFDERVSRLQILVSKLNLPWLQMITQHKLSSNQALDELLRRVEAQQGEGLMLHLGSAKHTSGRSSALLKLKSYQDAEARVMGYSPGKGKYEGMTGALIVENDKGLRFNLGSGLSDALRRQPPKIGMLVTYKFNGYTQRGIPRFARFWRIRQNPLKELL